MKPYSVVLSYSANPTDVKRYGSATISLDTLSQKITIIQDAAIPKPKVTEVINKPGGATIKFYVPGESSIKGVVAYYERHDGIEISSRVSRYVDSLTVDGFADSNPHMVRLHSFNVYEELSEPEIVVVNPLKPAIQTVTTSLVRTFGGVKIYLNGNESKSNLAVACSNAMIWTILASP